MRTTSYVLIAVSIVVGMSLLSCGKEEDTPKPEHLVFTVEGTKASWNATEGRLSFEVGDKVGLFSYWNDNVVLTVTNVSEGVATLEGIGVDEATMYAVYPYKKDAHLNTSTNSISGGYYVPDLLELTTDYPAEAISLAKVTSGSTTLSFKNLMTMFKITSPEAGTGGSIYNPYNPLYYGNITIFASSGEIMATSSANIISFANSFTADATYYLALPSFSANTLTIDVTRSAGGTIEKTITAESGLVKKYEAGTIYNVTIPSPL